MSVNSKMTAIADKIRAIRGTTGTMDLDAMATNLGTVQNDLTAAFTAIGNKGGTVPSSKVSGNLASAINSIPAGAAIQRKTGTFTSAASVTVNCGFQPDIFITQMTGNGKNYDLCFALAEHSNRWAMGMYGTYVIEMKATRTSSGVTLTINGYSASWGSVDISGTSVSYTAIKYT